MSLTSDSDAPCKVEDIPPVDAIVLSVCSHFGNVKMSRVILMPLLA